MRRVRADERETRASARARARARVRAAWGALVVAEILEAVAQPLQVVAQVLDAVHERAVRPVLERLHHVVDGDEVAHVELALVRQRVRRGVEVRDAHAPPPVAAVLLHRRAVRRLARTRGADDELAVLRHGLWGQRARAARVCVAREGAAGGTKAAIRVASRKAQARNA